MSQLRQLLQPCATYAFFLALMLLAFPDLLLAASVSAPFPRGSAGVSLDWLVVLVSLTALLLSNLRYLYRRFSSLRPKQ